MASPPSLDIIYVRASSVTLLQQTIGRRRWVQYVRLVDNNNLVISSVSMVTLRTVITVHYQQVIAHRS